MENETILLVGHGSRGAGGNQEVEAFANEWRARHPGRRVELCFIEFADVLLPTGLDEAAYGAKQVIVVPFILNAAGHVKMEIPEAVAVARIRHPGVDFYITPHLGVEEPLLKVVRRGLHRTMAAMDFPDPRNTGVVLLARGSSDPAANGEMARMARWLYEETDHDLVELAFTGITFPRLEAVIQRLDRLGMTQIAIVPYYLFTGTLMDRIKRQVTRLRQQYPRLWIEHSAHFGFEPEISELLDKRIQPDDNAGLLALLECDGCPYRKTAKTEGHHHIDAGGCAHRHKEHR
uniref:Sirohydrochlorin cobaltochelatase n=1 Tax=Candidatus Kentrum sp. SD TaxID=2126332 RepID=A0A450YFE0_9GAMM|nr:MAG: sirohydrochlorin cobaltochelatase [Candidatus Kentron sp. SD]